MISEERQERGRFTLVWALLLSVVLHAMLLPLLLWMGGVDIRIVPRRPPERELVVASTAIRIEKRPIPQPRARTARPSVSRPRSQPVRPQSAQPQRAQPVRTPSARHELARNAPTAPPQPKLQKRTEAHQKPSLEEQIAQQERAFSQEVARLNARNDPLSIATPAPQRPASYRRTFFDVPGHRQRTTVQALLIPLSHWYTNGLSCYYTRYVAQFGNGGSEDGVIPWPVCYPESEDRMAHPPYPHNLPIPVPQPGYVLPTNTYLTPLLRAVYNLRG